MLNLIISNREGVCQETGVNFEKHEQSFGAGNIRNTGKNYHQNLSKKITKKFQQNAPKKVKGVFLFIACLPAGTCDIKNESLRPV